MSTTELGRFEARPATRPSVAQELSALGVIRTALAPFASLRLTVVLLFLSIVLVFAGTLAQVDHDISFVIDEYFRAWFAWLELRIFFPRSWGIDPSIGTYFPGGQAIGLALAVNLVAAHGLRFKVAAHGARLWLGWLTIAIGAGITYAVIASGSNTSIESELSVRFVNGLWHALRATLGAAALTLAYVLALSRATARKSAARWLWWIGATTAAILASLVAYLFWNPETRLDASGLRILWQLAKATGASLVLAAGCWAVFRKRAGIVLLHGGIGLMMFTELYTAQNVVEARMTIAEGETAYFASDIRNVELAFVDKSQDGVDHNIVVPHWMLQQAAETGKDIQHSDLPFDVRVVDLIPNAQTRRIQPGEENRATAGLGQLYTVDELPTNSGVAQEQSVDLPAAYVELLSKGGGASQGVYLVAALTLNNDVVAAQGQDYEVALRFKRIPKPYRVTLLDFKFDRYIGTNTAKNFESVVRFEHDDQNIDRTKSISMNNPLRYGGDTLYQSSFDERTERSTVLQVMTNAGWMVPYTACMIVATGMLIHFVQAIVRFVLRREDEARRTALAAAGAPQASLEPWSVRWRRKEYWVPALVVLIAAAMTWREAKPPREAPLDMQIYEFGQLPVAYGGRTQPMDSLACNTLRLVSGKATYVDKAFDKPQPAIRWLLDVASRAPGFMDHRVLRIEHLEVLDTLGLEYRPGNWRYSLNELLDNAEEFDRQVNLSRSTPEEKRNLMQVKFLEASEKFARITTLMDAFSQADISGQTRDDVLANLQKLHQRIDMLNNLAPRPIPPASADAPWQTLLEADKNQLLSGIDPSLRRLVSPAAGALGDLLAAYGKHNAAAFNESLEKYREIVVAAADAETEREARLAEAGQSSDRKPAERLALDRIAFESFFNQFDPFVACIPFYIGAFLLAAAAWVFWPEMFNRSANWLLWFTFALHTFGIVCRIYISGRPPMTNLYSSAVFIGWAAVLLALIFESVYKLGIGNLLAAAIGFPTMLIAYRLTFDTVNDGDTIGVMQAVLDTNFWLGTHVVCMGLGYSTTLIAGVLGMITVLLGVVFRVLDDNQRRQLTRMTYGALCFAIFFSFVGTVLGGLWADDSWGRFWGWDPKENGALMIVLWNAIVLHARWGKMVGERGLAALAVLGNIVLAWSWWGVNQLGVGLHAYGEISGITFWLTVFAISQATIASVAYVWPLVTQQTPPSGTAAA